MISFSLWDILRNLLLAGRWTIVLSLATFLLGGMLGLFILFMRTSKSGTLRNVARVYICLLYTSPSPRD